MFKRVENNGKKYCVKKCNKNNRYKDCRLCAFGKEMRTFIGCEAPSHVRAGCMFGYYYKEVK